MKQIDHIIEKLNDLIILNEEIKNAFNKGSNKLGYIQYKNYSKQWALERTEYIKPLKRELMMLEGNHKNSMALNRRFHLVRVNFRRFIKIDNDLNFLEKVYEIEMLCAKKYDELLSQMNLPLSLCRTLLKQKDSIQARLFTIERGELIIEDSK